MFNALVISGGSFKGIAVLGSLLKYQEMNLLNNIKYYAGTSIGSLITLLLILDINPFEIFSFIYTESDLISVLFNQDNFIEYLTPRWNDINTGMGILRIYETFTIKIEQFILKKKGWTKLPSLLELHIMTNKHFFFIATKEDEYGNFSEEILSPFTHPDMSILRAIELSCNIPFLFCKIKYKGCEYVDGGFSDDFPYEKLKTYIKSNNELPDILGIYIKEENTKQKKNHISFLYRMITYPIYLNSMRMMKNLTNEERNKILILSVDVLDPTDFNIKKEKRMEYFVSGYNQASEFINTNKNEIIDGKFDTLY